MSSHLLDFFLSMREQGKRGCWFRLMKQLPRCSSFLHTSFPNSLKRLLQCLGTLGDVSWLGSLLRYTKSSGVAPLGEAKLVFSNHTPKGEITFLIEGKAICIAETPSESQLENELEELISNGHSLSVAVRVVAAGTSTRRKTIYSLALRKFGKQVDAEDDRSDDALNHITGHVTSGASN